MAGDKAREAHKTWGDILKLKEKREALLAERAKPDPLAVIEADIARASAQAEAEQAAGLEARRVELAQAAAEADTAVLAALEAAVPLILAARAIHEEQGNGISVLSAPMWALPAVVRDIREQQRVNAEAAQRAADPNKYAAEDRLADIERGRDALKGFELARKKQPYETFQIEKENTLHAIQMAAVQIERFTGQWPAMALIGLDVNRPAPPKPAPTSLREEMEQSISEPSVYLMGPELA